MVNSTSLDIPKPSSPMAMVIVVTSFHKKDLAGNFTENFFKWVYHIRPCTMDIFYLDEHVGFYAWFNLFEYVCDWVGIIFTPTNQSIDNASLVCPCLKETSLNNPMGKRLSFADFLFKFLVLHWSFLRVLVAVEKPHCCNY